MIAPFGKTIAAIKRWGKLWSGIALCCFLLSSGPSHGKDTSDAPSKRLNPRLGINVGLDAGLFALDGTKGLAGGVDATFFYQLSMPLFVYASAGSRGWLSDEIKSATPFGELGLSLAGGSVGVGYGPQFAKGSVSHTVHIYTGVNIPFWFPKRSRIVYLRLFYRPVFFLNATRSVAHEAGLGLHLLFGKNWD